MFYEEKEEIMALDVYTIDHLVTADEVTMNGTLRLSSLFALFQEIAGEDVERLGYGDAEFRQNGILWMLTRMRTWIARMPRYDETVTVSTWTGISGHGLYTRHYEIGDGRGASLVQACGIWVLVDGEKRELIRETVCHFVNMVTGRELPAPRHLSMPEGEATERTLSVPYGLCDLNGHLSNLRYPDVAEYLLPMEYLTSHTPMEADVDYLHEVLPDRPLTVRWTRDGDSWYFRGGTESPCFQMRLRYRSDDPDAKEIINRFS